MKPIAQSLGKVIRDAMLKIEPPAGTERPSTKQIYQALKAARPVLSKQFGDPVKCRYAGCPPVTNYMYCKRPLRVLEYLWDFSFSRFDIPHAIEQCGTMPGGSKYELLFVAESELGTAHEICRDLLKLLEARAAVRCLVYKQPKQPDRRQQLHSRMIRVLHKHALFDPKSEVWLFIGLVWCQGYLDCDVYTLNDEASELVTI